MAESVTVEQGSTSVTSNTATADELRAELDPPATPPEAAPPPPADPARDLRGRFAKAEQATPPADAPPPPEPVADPEPLARQRDEPLPRHDRIARMNQALAQKAEAERRAAALEAELARVRQGQPTPPPPAPPPGPGEAFPEWDQWIAAHPDHPDPYTGFQDAKWEWKAAQREAALFAKWEAAQQQQARAKTFEQRLAEGQTRFPDWQEALTQADTLGLQVSAVMQDAIAESPRAADLVHFLATHPEECTQLAEESQQTPVAAATVMRRLLESHLAPRAVPSNGTGAAARAVISAATPPVSPVGSSPVVSDEPPGDKASLAEHARYWNRKLKVPGTR